MQHVVLGQCDRAMSQIASETSMVVSRIANVRVGEESIVMNLACWKNAIMPYAVIPWINIHTNWLYLPELRVTFPGWRNPQTNGRTMKSMIWKPPSGIRIVLALHNTIDDLGAIICLTPYLLAIGKLAGTGKSMARLPIGNVYSDGKLCVPIPCSSVGSLVLADMLAKVWCAVNESTWNSEAMPPDVTDQCVRAMFSYDQEMRQIVPSGDQIKLSMPAVSHVIADALYEHLSKSSA